MLALKSDQYVRFLNDCLVSWILLFIDHGNKLATVLRDLARISVFLSLYHFQNNPVVYSMPPPQIFLVKLNQISCQMAI